MSWYLSVVQQYPIFSAMVQFAILGTLGEIVSYKVKGGQGFPFSLKITLGKMLGWAILAIMIKYAFTGFSGFVTALIDHHLLFKITSESTLLFAFFKSFFTNLMFGPILILTHRLFDNLIESKKNWSNLKGALLTLFWFWVPAHTITFSLPVEYQIGLAALWSLVLGVILGLFTTNSNIQTGQKKTTH